MTDRIQKLNERLNKVFLVSQNSQTDVCIVFAVLNIF